MSYETTLANAKAKAAALDWKDHRTHCHLCAPPRVRREDMCDVGIEIHDGHRSAQAELAENRRLDKLPIPGQGALPIG